MTLTEDTLRSLTEGRLRDALAAGDLDPVGHLPAPALTRVKVPDGELTALMLVAAVNQDPELVDVLVDAGAEVRATSPESLLTALSFAAMANPMGEVAARLIEYGANSDHRDIEGCTPLMRAAAVGNRGAVHAIMPHVSSVDDRDPGGWSALFYAVAGLNIDIANELLAAGASTGGQTEAGQSLADVYEFACKERGIEPAPEITARFGG